MKLLQVSRIALVFALIAFFSAASPGVAQSEETLRPPRDAFDVIRGRLANPTDSFFKNQYETIDIDKAPTSRNDEPEGKQVAITKTPKEKKSDPNAMSDKELLGNVDDNAPDAFKGIVTALRRGDQHGAAEAADLFVDYMINLMWEVREITKLIGGALLRRGLIQEEGWNGVEQYLEYELVQARKSMGTPIKSTHRESLKRIKADPQHKAEVYYFFTLSCSYCRYMASDIERLYRAVAKNDDRVKFVGLTLRNTPTTWVDSYRKHTGLTIPVFEGVEVADSLDVAFVPTMVVISPTTKKAYRRSGQMTFQHMYEFVRAVQGLPTEMPPAVRRLMKQPVSLAEQYGDTTYSAAKHKKLKNRRRYRPSAKGILAKVRQLGK